MTGATRSLSSASAPKSESSDRRPKPPVEAQSVAQVSRRAAVIDAPSGASTSVAAASGGSAKQENSGQPVKWRGGSRVEDHKKNATGDEAVAQDNEREYSAEEINKLTSEGYIIVHPGLWDHIAPGSHVRYVRRDDGTGKSRGKRFKPGGFVRNHFIDDGGRRMFTIDNRYKLGGKRAFPGQVSYSLAYDHIETLWKKYDKLSFIEIYLVHNSLAQKKQQIESLLARVEQLEHAVARLGGKMN
jgi:hypothetical protein